MLYYAAAAYEADLYCIMLVLMLSKKKSKDEEANDKFTYFVFLKELVVFQIVRERQMKRE